VDISEQMSGSLEVRTTNLCSTHTHTTRTPTELDTLTSMHTFGCVGFCAI